MKAHKLWKQGNSIVTSLSPDELEHLGLGDDGYIIITKLPRKKLEIQSFKEGRRTHERALALNSN